MGQFRSKPSEQRGREYDALLCYHDPTCRRFVKDNLMSPLEDNHGIKLCVEGRNFSSRKRKRRTIEKVIKECNSSIVVMSQELVNDGWCQEVFNLCYLESQRDSQFQMILILMQPYETLANTSGEIRKCLESNVHFSCNDDNLIGKIQELLNNPKQPGEVKTSADAADAAAATTAGTSASSTSDSDLSDLHDNDLHHSPGWFHNVLSWFRRQTTTRVSFDPRLPPGLESPSSLRSLETFQGSKKNSAISKKVDRSLSLPPDLSKLYNSDDEFGSSKSSGMFGSVNSQFSDYPNQPSGSRGSEFSRSGYFNRKEKGSPDSSYSSLHTSCSRSINFSEHHRGGVNMEEKQTKLVTKTPRSLITMSEEYITKLCPVGKLCTFYQGNHQYFGKVITGKETTLQGPDSDVTLTIPSGLHGFISGHVHTDPTPFLHAISDSECLIAPIVEYRWHCESRWFVIKMPHCLKNADDFLTVKVRHGNIHKKNPFVELKRGVEDGKILDSKGFYLINDKYITIYTCHFSQFICTVCKNVCQAEAKAFVFGCIYPNATAAIRLYLTSPLFSIQDYSKDLVQSERDCKRYLIDKKDFHWDAESLRGQEFVQTAIQSQKWNPSHPLKSTESWCQDTHTLVQQKPISQLGNMLQCHACRTWPSEVAHFDLEFQPQTGSQAGSDDVFFSGALTVRTETGQLLLEAKIQIFQEEPNQKQVNRDQLLLRNITKCLIITDEDLLDFGLRLGLTLAEIQQMRTNYQNSVETAALHLSCKWWANNFAPWGKKCEEIVEVTKEMGKAQLVSTIQDFIKAAKDKNETKVKEKEPVAHNLDIPTELVASGESHKKSSGAARGTEAQGVKTRSHSGESPVPNMGVAGYNSEEMLWVTVEGPHSLSNVQETMRPILNGPHPAQAPSAPPNLLASSSTPNPSEHNLTDSGQCSPVGSMGSPREPDADMCSSEGNSDFPSLVEGQAVGLVKGQPVSLANGQAVGLASCHVGSRENGRETRLCNGNEQCPVPGEHCRWNGSSTIDQGRGKRKGKTRGAIVSQNNHSGKPAEAEEILTDCQIKSNRRKTKRKTEGATSSISSSPM